MNASVASERKSFLPSRLRSTTVLGSNSHLPTVSRSTTPVPMSMTNDSKSSLVVGNHVLVNGLKSGVLRYIGVVKFAQGLFCGVELDEPEGKHDGQVNDVRYFQCKANHGVFVPREKVILATRERSYTTQRSVATSSSRLKPPMTRSMTVSSSSSANNKIEKSPVKVSSSSKATVQLPDIVPNPSTSTEPNPVKTDIQKPLPPTENIKPVVLPPPITIEEPPEIIEADFTDSISLLLHQLQQKPAPFGLSRSHSYAISEEGTIDDIGEDDEDDTESIAESFRSDRLSSIDQISLTKSIQTDLSFDIHEHVIITKNNLLNSKPLSYSNKSLASSTTSLNKLRINPLDHKKKMNLPTPAPVVKKVPERKLSVPLNTPSRPSLPLPSSPRRTSLVPPPTRKSITSYGSQSRLNHSLSSSNSVNSSHSDLTTSPKKLSKTPRTSSLSEKKPDQHDHQLMIQKAVIQSLETTSEYRKKQYQHLLKQFDLMSVINQFYINQTEQIKQDYELKLSKCRRGINRLKTSIEQLQTTHNNELNTIHEENENEIQSLKELHQQQSNQYQQEIDKLSTEKTNLESRCTTLQAEVDRFNDEMANSEYADPLLRRVDILEKDRNSLETALEIKTQELTQIRTKMNEQVFEREDQMVLQKRIDMAEHRNQDLVCLLRNWQLNEIAATVERDELKEQLANLERDNRQLIFEKETLLYGLRQRSTTIACMSIAEAHIPTTPAIQTSLERAQSYSSLLSSSNENPRIKRSTSLISISNR